MPGLFIFSDRISLCKPAWPQFAVMSHLSHPGKVILESGGGQTNGPTVGIHFQTQVNTGPNPKQKALSLLKKCKEQEMEF